MSVDVFIRHRFPAFALDLSFKVQHAGVTALFGPSGAGKTSVINAIAGLFRPDEGRIAIGGRVVLDTAAQICVPPQERRTGYVFQDARLFPHMTVAKNLRFGRRRARTKAGETEVDHVIDLLGLSRLLDRAPRALSGGEKGRVALGRALLSAPDILLLDEPLAALDAARRDEILPYLQRLRDETRLPMVYVSHSLDEVARLADEIVVLREGRVAAQGTVFDLLTRLEGGAGIGVVGAVLDARLAAHRAWEGLSELAFEGGTLLVPLLSRRPGERVRVRIRAEDIMLACVEPQAVSANNVLAATVTAVSADEASHANVQVRCGETRLVARITRASAARLALQPGMPVYAIIKSVIVDSSA